MTSASPETPLPTPPEPAPVPAEQQHTITVLSSPEDPPQPPTVEHASSVPEPPVEPPLDPAAVQSWLDAEKYWEWLKAEKAWQTTLDPKWTHKRVEFRNDYLAYRKANTAALQAVSITSAGKFALKYLDLFMSQHLGPDSYERVWSRMIDPGDPEYDDETVSGLIQLMSE